jgi:hypothetical protein
MRPRLLTIIASIAAVTGLVACAPSTPTTPTATTSAVATSTVTATTTPPAANLPVITAFQIIDDVDCSGAQASVPVSWATRNVQTVEFEVDRQPVSAGAGYPVNGIGNVPVPCDGKSHTVVLAAFGSGVQVSVARQVNTSNSPPPSDAPTIRRFDILDDITCSGSTVDAPGAWLTQNAQAVNFSVDGQPLPAAAGFPVSGVGNVAVPCDGHSHTVTLTATGSGASASLTRAVNTIDSSSSTTTTTTTTAPVPTTSSR